MKTVRDFLMDVGRFFVELSLFAAALAGALAVVFGIVHLIVKVVS
jgi:hypothetical protein